MTVEEGLLREYIMRFPGTVGNDNAMLMCNAFVEC